MMDELKFVVEASEAESITQKLGLPSVHHLLPMLVQPGQTLARPPISNYHVAAVGLGSDGRVFLGVNLEFPGLPLHHSVHAEQFLLTNLAVHRCPRLLAFAVSSAPCGHCRQFLQELRNSSDLQIHITSQHQNVTFEPLREILPNPFGPFDLLDDETPLLLERHNNGLSLRYDDGDLRNGFSDVFKAGDLSKITERESTLLRIAALEAANDSHAPYSGCPSGVAIMDCEGKIYRGSYMESAAYNPSLGPVQGALVAFVAGGGGGYERIVAAALVEKEGAKMFKKLCLADCNCTAYSNLDIRDGGSGCLLWFGDLIDIRELSPNQQDLLVRMAASEVVKDWLLIAFAWSVIKDTVTPVNLVGYGLAFLGMAYYNHAKLQALKANEAQKKAAQAADEGSGRLLKEKEGENGAKKNESQG